jgi:AAA+ superfamily predicted ATPase
MGATDTVTTRSSSLPLLPTQARSYAQLCEAIDLMSCVQVEGAAGQGKTTLLRRLVDERAGAYFDCRSLFGALAQSANASFESGVMRLVESALATHDLVAIDHIDCYCDGTAVLAYVRTGSYAALSHALPDMAESSGKRIVIAGVTAQRFSNYWAWNRALTVKIGPLELADFSALLEHELGADATAGMDVPALFEHAPDLNPYKLLQLAGFVRESGTLSPQATREILDTRILSANTQVQEIENLSFGDLKGFEPIAEALTTHVLNPMRGDDRLRGLGLRPKRGVLLYGPPGTGKTSVGRALARQMQGKFFLIDGTISPEPAGAFYGRLQVIFAAAKRAAPSILFVDDADLLFASDYAPGYLRYFLSMLDGLESESAGKVTVILTATDASGLPPALLRSGRVELWLETRAPEQRARSEIVAALMARLPAVLRTYDAERLTALTAGFSAADMRRLVNSVKAFYVADIVANRSVGNADGYIERAAADVQQNKALLQLADSGRFTFDASRAA